MPHQDLSDRVTAIEDFLRAHFDVTAHLDLASLKVHLTRMEHRIMAVADDLNTAVSSLTETVTALGEAVAASSAAIKSEIDQLKSAIGGNTVDPAVTKALENITKLNTSLATQVKNITADTASLVADDAPPPPPA